MERKTKKEKADKSKEQIIRVAAAFKALSNETRLSVFENLRLRNCQGTLDKDNRLSVCTVAGKFNMSISTISHHMKELRHAGLIRCERKGQTILCEPNEETIQMMVNYLTGQIQCK